MDHDFEVPWTRTNNAIKAIAAQSGQGKHMRVNDMNYGKIGGSHDLISMQPINRISRSNLYPDRDLLGPPRPPWKVETSLFTTWPMAFSRECFQSRKQLSCRELQYPPSSSLCPFPDPDRPYLCAWPAHVRDCIGFMVFQFFPALKRSSSIQGGSSLGDKLLPTATASSCDGLTTYS